MKRPLVCVRMCNGGPGGETFGSAGFPRWAGSPAPPSGPPPSSGDEVAGLQAIT